MAYGLEYFGEFWDFDGGAHRVEYRFVNKPNDLDAHRMTLAEKPLVIDQPDRGRFAAVCSRGLYVQAVNTLEEGTLFYARMFGGAENDWRVDYYYNGTLHFRGFVIPRLYTDSISSFPKIVEINANDRLSRLEDVKFDGGQFGPGTLSLIDLVSLMLELTGIVLPISIACRLFSERQTVSPTTTLFDQTYIIKDILFTSNEDLRSALTLLDEALKTFRCRVYQGVADDNGELNWIIDRIPYTVAPVMHYVRYENAVAVGSYDRTQTPQNLVSDIKMIKNDNAVSYQTGYKVAELGLSLQRFTNLISPGRAVLLLGTSVSEMHNQKAPYREWLERLTSGGTTSVVNVFPADPNGRTTDLFFALQPVPSAYNSANPITGRAYLDGIWTLTNFTSQPGATLNIEVEASYTGTLFLGENHICILEIFIYDQDPVVPTFGYLVETTVAGEPQGDWRLQSPNFPPADPDDPFDVANAYARVFKAHVFANDNTDYNDLENRTANYEWTIPLEPVLGSGNREFQVGVKLVCFRYGVDAQDNSLKDSTVYGTPVVVRSFDVNVTNIEMDNVWEATIDTNFIERYSENFLFAELNTVNYANTLRFSDGSRIFGWAEEENLTDPYQPLLQQQFKALYEQFQVPRFSVVTNTRQPFVQLTQLFQELETTGRVYYLTGVKSNARRAVTELSLVEVSEPGTIDFEVDFNVFNANRLGVGATLSEGDRRINISPGAADEYGTTAGTKPKDYNRWYVEFEIINVGTGTTIIGISSDRSGDPGGTILGEFQTHVGYRNTGEIYQQNSVIATRSTWTTGDVIGMEVYIYDPNTVTDNDAGEIQIYKNGTADGAPFAFIRPDFWSPAAGRLNGGNIDIRINCGQDSFTIPALSPRFNPGWFSTVFEFFFEQ